MVFDPKKWPNIKLFLNSDTGLKYSPKFVLYTLFLLKFFRIWSRWPELVIGPSLWVDIVNLLHVTNHCHSSSESSVTDCALVRLQFEVHCFYVLL